MNGALGSLYFCPPLLSCVGWQSGFVWWDGLVRAGWLCVGGAGEGKSVVPAAPALRPSAEWNPLLAQRRARNGHPAPGNGHGFVTLSVSG